MMALVGSNGSFAQGREQLEALAGLQVTTKAVERHAEAIGGDIAAGEQAERQRALQLELPTVRGPEIPVLYFEMDGTGVPMVTAETEGRVGKIAGETSSAGTQEVLRVQKLQTILLVLRRNPFSRIPAVLKLGRPPVRFPKRRAVLLHEKKS
jgi:hypothetical protein